MSTAIFLIAVPLLVSPPHPPHRLQRFAAGLFLSSAAIDALQRITA